MSAQQEVSKALDQPVDASDPAAVKASGDIDDLSKQVEVLFNDSEPSRRRASLMENPKSQMNDTACFVHSLLSNREQSAEPANLQGKLQQGPTDAKQIHPDGENGTSSRLLSKAQLATMAVNIRELSKKLSHIRMVLKVVNVFILTKAHDKQLIQYTRDVSEWLLKSKNIDGVPYIVWVENTMKENKDFNAQGLREMGSDFDSRLRFWDNEKCKKAPESFEAVVALGGDGTVLYASWLFQKIVPPVLPFSLGSLGFLTRFDFANYKDTLTRAFAQGVTVSLRLRFEGTVMRSQELKGVSPESRDIIDELVGKDRDKADTHRPDRTLNILNDIVLDRGPNPTMSTIEIFGGEEHFTTVQADGIIVATPTGSTAYNLAAGGSLCHPENPVILLTAIAPHTLNTRPLILPDTMVLRLAVPYDARASCWASFDGKER